MAQIPHLGNEVFYGSTDKPLPNWRQEDVQHDDDPDSVVDADALKAVTSVLGFDPREIGEEGDVVPLEANRQVSESAREKLAQIEGMSWVDYLLE